jgi:hypothetical protein
MMNGVDVRIALLITLQIIITQLNLPEIPIMICTDLFSLYECLVKLGTTQEKRLMIDIMALRQSYERKKIAEVRWIHNKNNSANALIKANANSLLKQLVSTNKLTVRMEEYVERPFARNKEEE